MPTVQQGHSAIIPPDAVALPIDSSAKWQLTRFDVPLDSGTRFDLPGPNGWSVEPAPGGNVRVSAPLSAVVGDDYDARLSLSAADIETFQNGHGPIPDENQGIGQSGGSSGSPSPDPTLRTASFSVTAYTAPPPPPPTGSIMPRYIYSTGELLVSLRLSQPNLSRVSKGAPSAATLPLSNLLDADLGTLTDLPQTNAANFSYLVVDYTATQTIGRVIAGNVAFAGGSSPNLKCYVSAAMIGNGDFSGATALVLAAAGSATGNDKEFIPTGGAASVSGRYVYLVPDSSTGCTIGDLDIRSQEYRIGTLQNVAPAFSSELKQLRGAAFHSLYAVADATSDAKAELAAETAELDENTVNLFTGALVSNPGSNPMTITPGVVHRPPTFVGEFRTRDIAGRAVHFIFYECVAPGFVFGLKRDDWAIPQFRLMVYVDETQTARAWRIKFRQ